MESIFLKSKELGIIEAHCIEALRDGSPPYTARDRARHVKKAVRLLRDCKLIPQHADVTALGKGCSTTGEFGVLVLFERRVVNAQGPREVCPMIDVTASEASKLDDGAGPGRPGSGM